VLLLWRDFWDLSCHCSRHCRHFTCSTFQMHGNATSVLIYWPYCDFCWSKQTSWTPQWAGLIDMFTLRLLVRFLMQIFSMPNDSDSWIPLDWKITAINYLSGSKLLKWSGFGSHTQKLRGKFKSGKVISCLSEASLVWGCLIPLHVHNSSLTSAH